MTAIVEPPATDKMVDKMIRGLEYRKAPQLMGIQLWFRRKIYTHQYSNDSVIMRGRARRMEAMLRLLRLPNRAHVVDLGGDIGIWKLINHGFHVTIVNLPDWKSQRCDDINYKYIYADACDLKETFADNTFSCVFSNSTIEHVGDESRQEMFAREVMRLAPSYWVQTPSRRCPIEAHTLVPFWWDLPTFCRTRMRNRWREYYPGFEAMIAGTRVLTRDRMKELFPGCNIYVEKRIGIEKSYSAYCPYPQSESVTPVKPIL